MKTIWAWLRTFGRRTLAVTVVAWCLLSPAAPVLQAISEANEACPCCKRAGMKSCPRHHHAMPDSGLLLDAAPSCGCGCTQTPGVAPPASHFAIQADWITNIIPAAEEATAAKTLPRSSSDISLWLQQRPPPRA